MNIICRHPNDAIRLVGIINAWLYGPDGELIMHTGTQNMIVNAGRVRIIALLDGDAVNTPGYIAIGTSNTAAAASQTALVGTELARSSVITPSKVDSNYTLRFSATFGAGTGTGDVYEAGLFCDSSAGTMLARGVLGTYIPKGAADSAVIQYDLSYAAS
jgi:hypothetical protein